MSILTKLFPAAALAAAATTAAAPPALAQQGCEAGGASPGSTCSAETRVTVAVPTLLRIQLQQGIEAGGPAREVLTSPRLGDFERGYSTDLDPGTPGGGAGDPARPFLRVLANQGWKLSMRAASANFTYTPPSGSGFTVTKPASDLLISASSTAPDFKELSLSDQTLLSGSAGGDGVPAAGRVGVVHQKILWSFERDRPGTYALDVFFTLAGN